MMASSKKHDEPSIDDKLAALKARQTTPVESTDKQITLQFNIPLTQNFKAKLPFLVVIFLLFVFTAVLFDKSNFKIIDFLNFARLDQNLGKLYSLSFILFLIVFSLTISLSIFYGHGISPWLAMLTLPLMLIGSLILGLFFPGLTVVFVALGVVISSAAFFSSLRKEVDWGRIWNVADQALLILVLLATVVVFLNATANQEVYTDALASGLAGSVTSDLTSSNGSQKPAFQLSNSDIEAALTLDVVKKTLPKPNAQKVLESAFGTVVMTDAQYEKFAGSLHTELNANSDVLAGELNKKIPSILSGGSGSSSVKGSISQLGALEPVFKNLPMILALTALLFASTLAFVIKLLSTSITFALFKYM